MPIDDIITDRDQRSVARTVRSVLGYLPEVRPAVIGGQPGVTIVLEDSLYPRQRDVLEDRLAAWPHEFVEQPTLSAHVLVDYSHMRD